MNPTLYLLHTIYKSIEFSAASTYSEHNIDMTGGGDEDEDDWHGVFWETFFIIDFPSTHFISTLRDDLIRSSLIEHVANIGTAEFLRFTYPKQSTVAQSNACQAHIASILLSLNFLDDYFLILVLPILG